MLLILLRQLVICVRVILFSYPLRHCLHLSNEVVYVGGAGIIDTDS